MFVILLKTAKSLQGPKHIFMGYLGLTAPGQLIDEIGNYSL